MSTLYPDLDLTSFPNSQDQRYVMIDPSTDADMSAINSYNTFLSAGNMNAAIQVLEDNPRLRRMLFNAEKWNRHEDMLIAMERFYESDVQKYLVNIVVYRGDWNASAAYSKYNVVYAKNWQAYMATRDVPAGTAVTNTEYFIPLTLKGDTGESGMGLSYRGAWVNNEVYYTDDCVIYDNCVWACRQQCVDVQPSSAATATWEAVFDVNDIIASMKFFTSHLVDLTIKPSDWVNKVYTYSNEELTVDSRVEVEPLRFTTGEDEQNYEILAEANIALELSAGKLKFTVRGTVPTTEVYVRVSISGRDSLAADSVKDDVAVAGRYAEQAKSSAAAAAASASKAANHTHTQSQIEGLSTTLSELQSKLTSRAIVVTASKDGWTGDTAPYSQTLNVPGMTATCNAIVGLANTATVEQRMAARKAVLFATEQGNGKVVVVCDERVPTVDLPVAITILEKGA